MKNNLTSQNVVSFIKDIFERRGAEEYLGERVTIAEHMLQAATLAEKEGCNETIIVAALLHDIGHFTSEFGSFSMNDEVLHTGFYPMSHYIFTMCTNKK